VSCSACYQKSWSCLPRWPDRGRRLLPGLAGPRSPAGVEGAGGRRPGGPCSGRWLVFGLGRRGHRGARRLRCQAHPADRRRRGRPSFTVRRARPPLLRGAPAAPRRWTPVRWPGVLVAGCPALPTTNCPKVPKLDLNPVARHPPGGRPGHGGPESGSGPAQPRGPVPQTAALNPGQAAVSSISAAGVVRDEGRCPMRRGACGRQRVPDVNGENGMNGNEAGNDRHQGRGPSAGNAGWGWTATRLQAERHRTRSPTWLTAPSSWGGRADRERRCSVSAAFHWAKPVPGATSSGTERSWREVPAVLLALGYFCWLGMSAPGLLCRRGSSGTPGVAGPVGPAPDRAGCAPVTSRSKSALAAGPEGAAVGGLPRAGPTDGPRSPHRAVLAGPGGPPRRPLPPHVLLIALCVLPGAGSDDGLLDRRKARGLGNWASGAIVGPQWDQALPLSRLASGEEKQWIRESGLRVPGHSTQTTRIANGLKAARRLTRTCGPVPGTTGRGGMPAAEYRPAVSGGSPSPGVTG